MDPIPNDQCYHLGDTWILYLTTNATTRVINRKSMQIRQKRRNVVTFGCSEDETGCTVHYFLNFVEDILRNSS